MAVRHDVPLRDRYDRLVQHAPDGILIHYGDRIVMANAAAANLIGAENAAELVGRSIGEFLSPPYFKALELWLIGNDERPPAAEPVRETLRRLDGSELAVDVTAIPFVEAGQPAAHLVIRDVTEHAAAEQLRAEVQKTAAVRTLAGGVAHEINNMMTVVLGFCEFLVADPTMADERRADAREIQKAADRAAAVARQLLAFSRPRPRVATGLVLDDFVTALRPLAERLLGAGRELRIVPNCTSRVWADAEELERIVTNLVLNSRDAMPAGGTLTIGTDSVVLKDAERIGAGGIHIPPGSYGTLVLADSGTGMDAATMKRIFEPFFTTKPIGDGTGLGLSVIAGLLQRNGAYVTVVSAPSRGTTFTLYFSLVPEGIDAPALPSESRASVPTLPVATILVVDDEAGVRTLAQRQLESGAAAYRVRQATNGLTALELVDRFGPPDVVLTDVMMPHMGGAELATRLRARWPRIPIVFMSGYAQDDLHRAGSVGPGERVVQKPFHPETLMRALADALRERAT